HDSRARHHHLFQRGLGGRTIGSARGAEREQDRRGQRGRTRLRRQLLFSRRPLRVVVHRIPPAALTLNNRCPPTVPGFRASRTSQNRDIRGCSATWLRRFFVIFQSVIPIRDDRSGD